MATPIHIGPKVFPNKAAAQRHYSEMLSRLTPQELIPYPEYPEAQELYWLLELHPRAAQKIGVGINAFIVDYGANSQNFCFHVIRVDGSQEDFSVRKCWAGDPSFRSRWLGACRDAIALPKSDIRNKMIADQAVNGLVPCAITGQWKPSHELHLDHIYPRTLLRIAREFWEIEDQPDDADLCFRPRTGSTMSEMFRDGSGLKEAFIEFHRKRSEGYLRLIGREQNLSLGSRPPSHQNV